MHRLARRATVGVAIVGLAAALLVVGAVAGGGTPEPAPPTAPTVTEAADPLDAAITDLTATVTRIPKNFRAWHELGSAYVQKARLTADPSYYGRAETAFARSLAIRPTPDALTGQATLAAARHDFADALRLADAALRDNDFSATTYGVKTDALVELGRYAEAARAVDRMVQLRPGTDAYARLSYVLELRGDVAQAKAAMEQAREDAVAPADQAFASQYLGELAWASGDLTAAKAAYDRALAADPSYLPSLAGRAKVLAAQGDPTAALADYREVVSRLPAPQYVTELGELLEATGQTPAAQQQYSVVRATQQLFAAAGADVDTELAVFEADHGTPAAAVASAAAAYRSRPHAVYVQDAYAWALHAAGRSREALPIAKQAVRTGFRNPSFQWHLGAIAAAAGDTTLARTALTRALELNPAFSPLHAPRAKALLASLPSS
ncbi:MAG: tetratricopeptide repeat protein [Mycobacteriales bacterium]|nr:tetratricopeptide repeat protein [Mycobacteriales bacterium]